jgi:hypothetical protein
MNRNITKGMMRFRKLNDGNSVAEAISFKTGIRTASIIIALMIPMTVLMISSGNLDYSEYSIVVSLSWIVFCEGLILFLMIDKYFFSFSIPIELLP